MGLIVFLCRVLPTSWLAAMARVLFSRTTRLLDAASHDVAGAQRQRLLDIVGRNAATTFGADHAFAEVKSVADFQARVPLSTYETYRDTIDRMVEGEKGALVDEDPFFFATTSGTTGRRKLIPVTSAYVAECKVTNRILFRTILTHLPEMMRGKRLSMQSPHTDDLGHGKVAGSITLALSGRLDETDVDTRSAIPPAVFRVKDFATRYYLCIRFGLQDSITEIAAVNPSTILLFARTLAQHADELARACDEGTLFSGPAWADLDDGVRASLEALARPAPAAAARIRQSRAAHDGQTRMGDVFADVAGLVCWQGGSAAWYIERLREQFGDVPMVDYGYAASEGCFGAPLAPNTAASVISPHGHFFEFAPEGDIDAVRAGDKPTKLLHELSVGEHVYVFVTTSAGLYRYDMNDVVEVVGKHEDAPLVVFRHKGGAMSSLTGEKLSEAHVVQAMAKAGAGGIDGFCIAPLVPAGTEAGRYLVAVDADPARMSDEDLAGLAAAFDDQLQAHNEEYEAKRKSLRLEPAVVCRLARGAFDAHRARRVGDGAPDAHVKVPHISPDGRLLLDVGLDDERWTGRLLCAQERAA